MTTPLDPVHTITQRELRQGAAWGVSVTLAGLLIAGMLALGVDRLARGRVGVGIALFAAVVVARGFLMMIVDRWAARVARARRQRERARILDHFSAPASESSVTPLEIVSAIDTMVDEPRLAAVRASAVSAVLALALVFWTGGWQAVGIIVVLLGLAVPLYQRAGRRAAALDEQYRERRARLTQRQLELLAHAPELRALGAVHYGANEIAGLSTAEHHVALRAIRTALGSSLVTEFLGGVSVGLVAMDVGFGLLHGRVSLVRALVCVLVTSELFVHVRRFGVEFHRREAVTDALERLARRERSVTPPAPIVSVRDVVTAAHPTPISLDVAAGDRIALLGPSGSGKTTLAHTLLGWRPARSGDVARTSDALAYVSADTALVHGSLGDNLRLGADFTDDELSRVMTDLGLVGGRFAHLDATVSSDGEGFSSGERIRLLVARALVHRPRLLILDDVAGLLDRTAREALTREFDRHRELAILEVAVDDALFISATHEIRLT